MANTNVYTASYLLASLRRRGQIPTATDGSFSPDALLAMCSEECQEYMVNLMMGVREEWFVRAHDVPLVGGQTHYPLPERTIGSKLRQLLVGTAPNNWIVITRIEPKQQYGAFYGYSNNYVGYATGYIFENTDVVLLSPAPAGQTLRMMYFLRPNRIVEESACGKIVNITGANALTVDSANVPTTFTVGTTCDYIKATPGFDTLAMDQEIATVDSLTGAITFTEDLPDDLSVGDYVCLAGETPIPQLPVELHPLLAQRVVVKVLEALGDPKMETALRNCEAQRQAAITLLSPRSEGDSRFLTNFNAPGWGGRRWRGW